MAFRIRMLAPVGFALFLLVAGFTLVSAQTAPPSSPQGAHTPTSPHATCVDGAQPSGAKYRICLPAQGWNGDLVVYAHGYVAPTRPVELPEDQMQLNGVVLADVVTQSGFAFAATSYRHNGLVMREGVDDLVELVNLFAQTYQTPGHVILTGVSEGGAITVMALEQQPHVFNGGLALCGPYGNFQQQVDYFSNFRAVFDYYFPGLIPPTPIDVPPDLLTTWETNYYSETVKPVITAASSALSVTQVLSVTGAPIDPNKPASFEQTFGQILWYNVYSTNDGKQRLGGNPFSNEPYTYTGSLDDQALNNGVFRTLADITATLTISDYYQTTGRVTVPLIIMHTSGDEVVPYAQAALYEQKLAAAHTAPWYDIRRVHAYGHCRFNMLDVLGAFNTLVVKVNDFKPYKLYIPTVATGQ